MEPNTSQGSVATYARCGGILKNPLYYKVNNPPVKEYFENRLRFDRNMAMSLACSFLSILYIIG